MNKILVSIILIFALLMCLGSCAVEDELEGLESKTNTNQNELIPQANATVYDSLNKLVQTKYKKVNLDITSVTGDVELTSNYVLTDSVVSYSVEQLNKLPIDGNIENISPNYKKTLTGTAKIENGKVTTLDGESVTLPSYDELSGKFNFKENVFKSIKIEAGKFTAEVVSISEFLGIDKAIDEMTIVVEYTSSALQKITITYKTTNSTVTTVYEFEK